VAPGARSKTPVENTSGRRPANPRLNESLRAQKKEMIMSHSTILAPCTVAGSGILTALGATLKRLFAAYIAWRIERSAIAVLRSMSDRELSDIGLPRGDIREAVRGNAARWRAYVPEC
jgi:uncharacterized protein YjiS (DUF1127 family)